MPHELTRKEIESFEALLRALHSRLSGDVAHLEQDALDPAENPRDQDDAGGDEPSRTLDLELLADEQTLLRQVGDALERIQDGVYGRCEECGRWISAERLRAIPYARLCFACQERTGPRGPA